jgi:hypothetical protein
MAKTPLLLAFGRHSGNISGSAIPPNRDFFRFAAAPFIERAVGRGHGATLIHQYRLVLDPVGSNRQEQERHAAPQLAAHERAIREMLATTLDLGRPAPHPGPAASLLAQLDWGLIDMIMDINSRCPGAIKNLIEPQTPGQVSLSCAYHTPCEGLGKRDARLIREGDAIRTAIALSKHRSRQVRQLALRLGEEEPERAIAITRSYEHAGMTRLFRHDGFALDTQSDDSLTQPFTCMALIRSYSRNLTPQELRRYALLSIHFNEYLEQAMAERAGALPGADETADLAARAKRHAYAVVDGPATRRESA